ncbi:type II toxin-antitoxin system VapC family toxin [Spirosoma taeanense]|uniref:Type II toxin-antitoxin system VapC family toxin n=1 Tax=Spirosoma taeanense TaxID=2735870 RepID=A0A6M5YBD1_9BACT|nr:type II toxin-antitoxin system VapC family toxin [Spirosoma taeanense]QJW90563.1 type II toxin-antitoxin system VapC family toxin [Spirosoma taeanense]
MILDSNIIIYSAKPEYIRLTRYLQANQEIVRVSLISTLEVLGFSRLSVTDKQIFEAYLNSVHILPITEAVITEAIRLRQQRKRSVGDAIIAATALIHNQPVLTNNPADFADIAGLQVIALAEILNA